MRREDRARLALSYKDEYEVARLQLGPWFTPALQGLSRLRGLRGTPFDPFGYAHLRKEERRLVSWYLGLVRSALAELTPQNYDAVVAVATVPDRIRGYEDIKLKSIAAAEAHAAVLMRSLARPAILPASIATAGR